MTRAGFIAVVGRPNAGKSTLLNALVGEPLAIVTAKAQTTRRRMTGIVTSGENQWIFVDTPGLLDPRTLFDQALAEAARQAMRDADVVLALLDGAGESDTDLSRLQAALTHAKVPIVVAISKTDVADPAVVARLRSWAEATVRPRAVAEVSAPEGSGLESLLAYLAQQLPEGPHLYPADDLSTDSMRDLVEEKVRETVLENYRQEIPYSVVCSVEEFRENEDPVYISVTIYVERESQKRIVIGSKGEGIRAVGIEARRKVEDLVGRQVYLDLWVKVLKDWRRKPEQLSRFGFVVPDGGAAG